MEPINSGANSRQKIYTSIAVSRNSFNDDTPSESMVASLNQSNLKETIQSDLQIMKKVTQRFKRKATLG
jgi:hypothetical protein